MLERLEEIFREMNLASTFEGMLKAALLGLEELIGGCRARVLPRSFELMSRLRMSELDRGFILARKKEEDDVIERAEESGRTVLDSAGIDSDRVHCCVVPFRGGVLYLDSTEPFSSEAASVAGMVAQQLVAGLGSHSFQMVRSSKDPLKELKGESWFNNQLHKYSRCSIIFFEIDGFDKFKRRRAWGTDDEVLRELAVFLGHQLGPRDLLARCGSGEFIFLSQRTDKEEIVEHWSQAMAEFTSIGVARKYSLTVSAGVAVCPEDGSPHTVRELAQRACGRASLSGNRILAVAGPGRAGMVLEGEPLERFDPHSTSVVAEAVKECQVRGRAVDPPALLWGLLSEDSPVGGLLGRSGLDPERLGEWLETSTEEASEFTDSTQVAFALSLEYAQRNGRQTVGVEELFLACLCAPGTDTVLRECGLNYGKLLAGLFRSGHFTSSGGFLVGDFSISRGGYLTERRPLPKKNVAKMLKTAFGENFSAAIWAILGTARTEAKNARHNLDFEHLYLAVMLWDELPVEKGREALKLLGKREVAPEDSVTCAEVLEFFEDLEQDYQDVTTTDLAHRLQRHPQVKRFIDIIEGLP